MERKYIGIVKDHLGTLDTHKTKSYSTYKEAHDAAEKLCKKTLAERGVIDVMEASRRIKRQPNCLQISGYVSDGESDDA